MVMGRHTNQLHTTSKKQPQPNSNNSILVNNNQRGTWTQNVNPVTFETMHAKMDIVISKRRLSKRNEANKKQKFAEKINSIGQLEYFPPTCHCDLVTFECPSVCYISYVVRPESSYFRRYHIGLYDLVIG